MNTDRPDQAAQQHHPDHPEVAVLDIMQQNVQQFPPTLIAALPEEQQTPYHVLAATLLSLRTRDLMTAQCAARLFSEADTVEQLAQLPEERIADLIYPVGFYRNKAAQLKELARRVVEEYSGRIPDTEEELLSFKGVGRKTANLVLSQGFGIPAICVDIHVHRICNRLGWITTEKPDETEQELMKLFPEQQWHRINDLFVRWGQNICTSRSPRCSVCPLVQYCAQVAVERSR